MAKKLYVGNLAYTMTEEELRSTFEEYGTVVSAQVVRDRSTGKAKGFGFVEMAKDEEAQAAIAALDGVEVLGRALKVNEARPKEEKGESFHPRSGGNRRY
jgi:RNA recognition motif-containing protein